MSDIAQFVQKYIDQVAEIIEQERKPIPSPVFVDQFASKIAKAYEQIRQVIDWKEEHIVRRNAIERFLKRNLLPKIAGLGKEATQEATDLAEPLVKELMRSGHLENGQIATTRIQRVQEILTKYIILLSYQLQQIASIDLKHKINSLNDLNELAACEIEDTLAPAGRQHALMELMTNTLHSKIETLPTNQLNDHQTRLFTYIGVQRALFNLDNPVVTYNLIKQEYPQWFADPQRLAPQAGRIQAEIQEWLSHPMGKGFYRLASDYDAAYLLLGDVTDLATQDHDSPQQALAEVYSDTKQLLEQLNQVYQARLATLKRRLARSAALSTLSILVSGLASFILFEGPIAKIVTGEDFSLFALFVDLMVPTALMFLFVVIIRPPKPQNFERVKAEVKKIVQPPQASDRYLVKLTQKNSIARIIFTLISLTAGSWFLLLVFYIFDLAGVPWTSLYIDTVMVAMIIFAALIIRDRSKEITIDDQGSLMEFVLDLFTLPLAKLGQYLSEKWREYNIVSVFFTVLVDTPLTALVTAIEDWRNFLKETRSDIH